jgi:hypothetical protein
MSPSNSLPISAFSHVKGEDQGHGASLSLQRLALVEDAVLLIDAPSRFSPLPTGTIVSLGGRAHTVVEVVTRHSIPIAIVLEAVPEAGFKQYGETEFTLVCCHAKTNKDIRYVLNPGRMSFFSPTTGKNIKLHAMSCSIVTNYVWPRFHAVLERRLAEDRGELGPIRVNMCGMSMGGMLIQVLALLTVSVFPPSKVRIQSPIIMIGSPRVGNNDFYAVMQSRGVSFKTLASSELSADGSRVIVDPVVFFGCKQAVSPALQVVIPPTPGSYLPPGLYTIDPAACELTRTGLLDLVRYRYMHSRERYEEASRVLRSQI